MDQGAYAFLQIILFVGRILITVYCVNTAKKLNRSGTGWGFFGFFLPIVALIWIQFMKPIMVWDKDVDINQAENK
jgi:uncharacterized membrane protein YecN with MAPEG domain